MSKTLVPTFVAPCVEEDPTFGEVAIRQECCSCNKYGMFSCNVQFEDGAYCGCCDNCHSGGGDAVATCLLDKPEYPDLGACPACLKPMLECICEEVTVVTPDEAALEQQVAHDADQKQQQAEALVHKRYVEAMSATPEEAAAYLKRTAQPQDKAVVRKDYGPRSIRCPGCKDRHETVAQVKLCQVTQSSK